MDLKLNILCVFQVDKSDSGTYTCDIENEYGSAKATIKVVVIGMLQILVPITPCENPNMKF